MPRPSPVRDAVVGRLRESERHTWTVEEMLSDLEAAGVAADFSSVFRGLVWGESSGLVQRIDVGDGRAHFERTGDHHEHVQCERCGRVTEVPGCLVEEASVNLERATGYRVSAHRLLFVGLCPDCQQQ